MRALNVSEPWGLDALTIDKVFPWTQARAAFEAMRAAEHFGKIVLAFGVQP